MKKQHSVTGPFVHRVVISRILHSVGLMCVRQHEFTDIHSLIIEYVLLSLFQPLCYPMNVNTLWALQNNQVIIRGGHELPICANWFFVQTGV